MILAPVQRDTEWVLLSETGHTVKTGFPDRDAAIQWAEANGHTAYDSQGTPIPPQDGEGRF